MAKDPKNLKDVNEPDLATATASAREWFDEECDMSLILSKDVSKLSKKFHIRCAFKTQLTAVMQCIAAAR